MVSNEEVPCLFPRLLRDEMKMKRMVPVERRVVPRTRLFGESFHRVCGLEPGWKLNSSGFERVQPEEEQEESLVAAYLMLDALEFGPDNPSLRSVMTNEDEMVLVLDGRWSFDFIALCPGKKNSYLMTCIVAVLCFVDFSNHRRRCPRS